VRRAVAALLLAALAAAAAPAAAAPARITPVVSRNWSGYAVATRDRATRFRQVGGAWTVPEVVCTPHRATYASNWVGIGGYYGDATTLAQIGTESDCRADGSLYYSAWTELVPAPTRRLELTVRPGDRVTASVRVRGRAVHLEMDDLTTGVSRTRDLTADRDPDLSSAEWILEAPAICKSGTVGCKVLPLAQFDDSRFSDAEVTTTRAITSGVTSVHYPSLAITMRALQAFSVGDGRSTPVTLTATPGRPTSAARAFTITFRREPAPGPLSARRSRSSP
jgi:hypothetical protein